MPELEFKGVKSFDVQIFFPSNTCPKYLKDLPARKNYKVFLYRFYSLWSCLAFCGKTFYLLTKTKIQQGLRLAYTVF